MKELNLQENIARSFVQCGISSGRLPNGHLKHHQIKSPTHSLGNTILVTKKMPFFNRKQTENQKKKKIRTR